MKFFIYDNVNGNVIINDESILLISEFEALLEPSRNITKSDKTGKLKTKAFRELKYIYLFFDWTSPYFQFTEQDRHREAFKDASLIYTEFDDPIFKTACQKYDSLQNSSLDLKMLKSAMGAVEKQIFYLDNVDLQERDPLSGKPIFKSKDLIAEIKGCRDLISTLRELEMQVKRGLETESTLRGNTEIGLFD